MHSSYSGSVELPAFVFAPSAAVAAACASFIPGFGHIVRLESAGAEYP
jgi:hypothetical protein